MCPVILAASPPASLKMLSKRKSQALSLIISRLENTASIPRFFSSEANHSSSLLPANTILCRQRPSTACQILLGTPVQCGATSLSYRWRHGSRLSTGWAINRLSSSQDDRLGSVLLHHHVEKQQSKDRARVVATHRWWLPLLYHRAPGFDHADMDS